MNIFIFVVHIWTRIACGMFRISRKAIVYKKILKLVFSDSLNTLYNIKRCVSTLCILQIRFQNVEANQFLPIFLPFFFLALIFFISTLKYMNFNVSWYFLRRWCCRLLSAHSSPMKNSKRWPKERLFNVNRVQHFFFNRSCWMLQWFRIPLDMIEKKKKKIISFQ